MTTAIRSNENAWESPNLPSCHIPPAVKPVKRSPSTWIRLIFFVRCERLLDRGSHDGVVVGRDLSDSLDPDDPVGQSLHELDHLARLVRAEARGDRACGRPGLDHRSCPVSRATPCATAWIDACSCRACSSSCDVGGFRSKTTFLTVPVNGYGALSS